MPVPNAKTVSARSMSSLTVRVLIALALAVAVLMVFSPATGHQFVTYDDDVYVTDNAWVRQGLAGSSVRWAFTAVHGGNWHPLTWLSHMLDVQCYGLQPWGHHLTNLVLHTLSAVLLFLLLVRVTGAIGYSIAAALLWALHPLRVESVAWVAERKDVLSVCLGLLTLLAYVRYADRPAPWRYGLALGIFALGLSAKPMLVTLPAVLLLLDVWPLRRWGHVPRPRLLREKLPFLVLAVASSAMTLTAQRAGLHSFDLLPFGVRLANAVVAYVGYLGKALWPSDLAVLYPHPGASLPTWQVFGAVVVLIAISTAVWMRARRRPYLAIGWLWYLGTLVPVIGLVQVGDQAMADRYTYLPMIGPTVAVVWVVSEWLAQRRLQWIGRLAVGLVAAGCLVGTRVQLGHWRNSETLYRHAIGVTGDNPMIQTNLGAALARQGRWQDAAGCYQEALRLRPSLAKTHANLVSALMALQRYDEATVHCVEALRLDPTLADVHNNFGLLLAQQHRLDEAVDHYRRALAIQPEYAEAHNNLGAALCQQRRVEEGIDHLAKALRLHPQYAAAHVNLGNALVYQGRFDEAERHYAEALRIDPQLAQAQRGLEMVRQRRSR